MIKQLRLTKTFDAIRMRTELEKLEAGLWKDHYNKAHYQGSWQVLPLRAINGDAENIVSIHAGGKNHEAAYANTPLLAECPYIQSVLEFFECEKTTIRLMKLDAGASIKTHCDHDLCYEDGEVRFHIPVMTNEQVHFMHEAERVLMDEGSCWYLNLTLDHAVHNKSKQARVHLVIDCLVNEWVHQLFNDPVHFKKTGTAKNIPIPANDKALIIAELRRQGTTTALALANQMEQE